MDWKDIGSKVADAAPLLGSLLGGPGGATVGAWISKAFGSASGKPEDVLAAMQKDAEWTYKLKQLEVEREKDILTLQNQLAITELTASVDSLKAVNETMRAESASEDPWQRRWRPFIGFVFGGSFAVVACFVCVLMYLAIFEKNHEAMRAIPDLVDTFTMLFGIPGAILGVTAYGRNKLKIQKATK